MKLYSSLFRISLLVFAVILLLTAPHAWAQAQSAAQMAASASQSAATQIPVVPARITQAIDETQLVTLKGNVHPLARPEFDQGPVSDATPMNRIQFVLKRSDEQEAALQTLMGEQLSKDSPNFQKWLTPQQFGQMFGPADADIQTITMWLNSHGFSGTRVSPGKTYMEFSGNVGQVRSAFHTDIHKFVVNGEQRQANTSDPQIPAALTPVVAGIASLHNFPFQSHRHAKGPAIQATLPDFTGTSNNFFAVGPADFAKIYNIPAALDGTGGKIAIVGFSDINPADVDAFRTLFSLPAKNLNIVVNGGDPGFGTEEDEAALDVQASGAVAPKAQIDYILSEGTLTEDPLLLSAEYVIDNNSDDIMSLSFGNCEVGLGTGNGLISSLWEEAAAQGITVVVSAGDNGPAGCDDFNTQTSAAGGIAVNGLGSTPSNIAVGGTDFDDVGTQISGGFWSSSNGTGRESAQGYIHEVPWNDSCAAAATSANLNTVCATPNNIVAGSGGPSAIYARPSFQSGVIPNGITSSDAANHRYLPDVSLFASDGLNSKSFYVECLSDAGGSCVPNGQGQFSFFPVGGTSAAAPSFAGILALIGQSESIASRSRRLGNANFVLYKLAQTPANSCDSSAQAVSPPSTTCIFYNITKGTNDVPCANGAAANCSATSNGVLVAPSSATTPAFTTTAGTGSIPSYDLATGLGSVNVTNLANNWGTALSGFHTTTTTTKVNGGTATVNITHGASVTLAATVSSTSGTPTGDVSWLAPTTVNGGVADQTLSGGSASVTTTFLPGGSYSIKAHYTGDGTFAASDDPTGVSVNVTKEASHLQYGIVTFDPNTGNITSTNATSFAYGSPYILRFDILNSTGNSTNCQLLTTGVSTGCAFDATGTITITDNGSPLDGGTFQVNSEGSSEDQPIQLSGGSHALVATYSGDISYTAPASVNDTVTVNKAATATVLTPSTNSATTGTNITLTATISSASNSATGTTGTVTFFDGTTQIGSPATVTPTGAGATGAGGTAALTTAFTTTGTHTLTATYNGDTNYLASAPSAGVVVTVTSTGSFAVSGAAVTVTAGSSGTSNITVTPSGGFTGTVNVTCGTNIPGVTCTPNPLAINITSANPMANNLTVNVAAPSSTLTASAAQLDRNVYAAGLRPPIGGGTGWWLLSGATALAAILMLLLPGRRRLRYALALSLASVFVMTFALGCGGGGGGGGGGPVATVTKLTISSAKLAVSASITVSATVTGGTPAGNVQFFADGAAIGSAVPVSGGTTGNITVTAANAPALLQLIGTHTLSAHYLGDANTMASQSGTLNVTITGTANLNITGTSGNTSSNGTISLTIN